MGGPGSGGKPRQYPEHIVRLACDLYQSGMTVREVDAAIPKGYKAQRILERHLPARRSVGKRDQRGPRNDAWKGGDAGYSAAHLRLAATKGPAKGHACIDCGERAADWSYQGGCPDEKRDHRKGCAYSTDPSFYVPRCKSCHVANDRARTPDGRFAPAGWGAVA